MSISLNRVANRSPESQYTKIETNAQHVISLVGHINKREKLFEAFALNQLSQFSYFIIIREIGIFNESISDYEKTNEVFRSKR